MKVLTVDEGTARVVEEAAAELQMTEEEAITAIICDWAAKQGLILDYGLEEDTPTLGQAIKPDALPLNEKEPPPAKASGGYAGESDAGLLGGGAESFFGCRRKAIPCIRLAA